MAKYRLSNEAKNDLIRIHHYGVKKFGMIQADKYFYSFFEYFDIIAERPFSFESVDYIKKGYRRCVCGVDSIYYKVNEDIIEIMDLLHLTGQLEKSMFVVQIKSETCQNQKEGILRSSNKKQLNRVV
ncbi:type II toxin-antitoxin system RelE/ParE family toxin [Maribacter sp. 2304DJ31-5]|uniref:type II toxin-antitoxin system RelE/ParE family toxin n=1 Tax=Maribacter sp. 2304DJ31-5 TaxID=3386273 RepID=UPI0039BC5F2B